MKPFSFVYKHEGLPVPVLDVAKFLNISKYDTQQNTRQKNKVYINQNGILDTTPAWQSDEEDATRSVTWGDVDGIVH